MNEELSSVTSLPSSEISVASSVPSVASEDELESELSGELNPTSPPSDGSLEFDPPSPPSSNSSHSHSSSPMPLSAESSPSSIPSSSHGLRTAPLLENEEDELTLETDVAEHTQLLLVCDVEVLEDENSI